MAASEQLAQRQFPSSSRDIERLITPEGSLYASSGEAYQYMLFGRDSLEAADDLLESEPQLALKVIDSMAKLQGVEHNGANAEEFGKIPHQHMQLLINGQRIPPTAEKQMHRLSAQWGGNGKGFTYYGSLDATPLFGRLIARYGLINGSELLQDTVTSQSGETITRLESFRRALNWICDHLDSSELSLLEFRRLNDSHIVFQSWRDSGSAFVHSDGKQANLDGFIAPLEVQGYGYDALSLGSRLVREAGLDIPEHERWAEHGAKLLETTLDKFWLPDEKRFAMALDRDKDNDWQERPIRTPSSSSGALLDTRLFFDLEEERRAEFVGSIVLDLYGQDFLTDIGVRCRGASAADLVPFADYHGSQAVWTKETYDFTKGLWRHGFPNLARDMSNRILNMCNISGENYEFLYVTPEGDVDYDPKEYTPGMEVDEIISATNLPDKGQAWTASAVYAIKRGLRPRNRHEPADWSAKIETELLDSATVVELITSPDDVEKIRRTSTNFAIDIPAGVIADRQWNPRWWHQ